jgi:hypothetical protein
MDALITGLITIELSRDMFQFKYGAGAMRDFRIKWLS